jgi:enoyl-CoA hydratase
MSEAEPRVAVESADGVTTLTFDNPRRHNSLTLTMVEEANRLLAAVAADPTARVVVLRGAGERAFCAGVDIGEQDDEDVRARLVEGANALIGAVGELPVPVVALLRGYCLGAGAALAAQADLRLGSDDAVYGVPAARLGLAYPFPEVARLTALVGPGAAGDLLLSGRRADAEECLRWGLLQAVHPAAEFEREAAAAVAAIASAAPLSLRSAKRSLRVAATPAVDDGTLAELRAMVLGCAESSDYAEGRRAFLERRAPDFRGA